MLNKYELRTKAEALQGLMMEADSVEDSNQRLMSYVYSVGSEMMFDPELYLDDITCWNDELVNAPTTAVMYKTCHEIVDTLYENLEVDK